MDMIKYSLEDEMAYRIDRDSFEHKTKMVDPYYENTANPSEGSQFAICPSCNNPVQVIGLYKKSEHTDKPFAKHFPSSVKNLANYIKENYEYCPLRAKRVKHAEYAKRAKANPLTRAIIQRLLESFDKIVYFWEEQIGIIISDSLAQKMLRHYFNNQGYLFYDASLSNVPLVFVHATFPAHALYGRIVFREAFRNELQQAHPNIAFDEDNRLISKNGKFLAVNFSFMHHKIHHDGEKVYETIKFIVSIRKNNQTDSDICYTKEIRFDIQSYQKFLNHLEKKGAPQKLQRSKRLLELTKLYKQYI